jgi:iron complex transport system ATP-binding protein
MLQLDALSVTIGNVQVCRDLSMSITPGQRWALLGINGVGKSTLMLTLAGLRTPQAGRVLLDGMPLSDVPPRQRARRIGLMSQDDEFAQETRVIDAVMLGRLPHRPWWAGPSSEDMSIAEAALARVGLGTEFAARLALTLSGGERRRVALASLLAQDSELLILDEPTNHLDLHQQVALLELLSGLAGHTLLMSLHDINLALRFCSHALLMFGDGQCCGGPVKDMLNADVLTRLYRHDIRCHHANGVQIFLPA